MHDEQTLKWFERYGLKKPEHVSHGVTPDDIGDRLRQLKPYAWRLEGNKLIGLTDMGNLVQTIPTDYVLEGRSENGLPRFRKIEIQK